MRHRTGPRLQGACAPTWLALGLTLALGSAWARAQAPAAPPPWTVVGDGIPASLSGQPGDAARGRAIVASRQQGLCLLCHRGPVPEERFQGNLAPDLAGAGTRWSAAQLRLRLVDSRQLNPDSIMPAYHRTEGLTRVGKAWEGQPILSAQQIEDVLAYLLTLRNGAQRGH